MQFERFQIDPENRELVVDGAQVVVRPRTFDVLFHLASRPKTLISKKELLEHVWGSVAVTDGVLTVCISEARQALGDHGRSPNLIQTVHGRGYRLMAEPAIVAAPPREALIGRAKELTEIETALQQASAGRRQLLFVTGESGIGKSALIEAALARLEAGTASPSWLIGEGQCIHQRGAGEAYLPVMEALVRMGCSDRTGRFVALLREHAPTWLVHLPSLVPSAALSELRMQLGDTSQDRMLRELTIGLEAISRELAMVMVLEDLQWSDHSTLDLLASIAQQRQPMRLLILASYRPSDLIVAGHPLRPLVHELQRKRLSHELPLELLSERQVGSYLETRFHRDLPIELIGLLHLLSAGNPLFLCTAADHLARSSSAGEWPVFEELRTALPQGLRPLIRRQIDQLSASERAVVDAASVVGNEFAVPAVAAALGRNPQDVEVECERLIGRRIFEFVGSHQWPDRTTVAEFSFRHSLYREVAYAALPASARERYHRQVASRLEAAHGGGDASVAPALAIHFAGARDPDRAAAYHEVAADRALTQGAPNEAIIHLDAAARAVASLPQDAANKQRQLDLLLRQASLVGNATGQSSRQMQSLYSRAQQLADAVGDPARAFWVLRGVELYCRTNGDLEAATTVARDLFRIADDSRAPALLQEAHRIRGSIQFWSGALLEAQMEFDQALAFGPGLTPIELGGGRDETWIRCLSYNATLAWLRGYPDRAVSYADEALQRVVAQSAIALQLLTKVLATWVFIMRRDYGRVLELADEVHAQAIGCGAEFWATVAAIMRAWATIRSGGGEAGLQDLLNALERYELLGAGRPTVDFYMLLADGHLCLGHAEAGLRALDDADRRQVRFRQRYFAAELHRIRAELLLCADPSRTTEAKQILSHSIALARAQGSPSLELRAALSLLPLTPKPVSTAGGLVARLYGSIAEGRDTEDLKSAALALGHPL